jgi:type I restriction enzyme M protein
MIIATRAYVRRNCPLQAKAAKSRLKIRIDGHARLPGWAVKAKAEALAWASHSTGTMLQSVITGELRSKIDRLWDAFWSGGISNPLEVIEQITYLMFIKRLDGIQITKEHKANRTGQPVESPIYTPEANLLRWSKFNELQPEQMYEVVADGVFPWLRQLGGNDTTYSHHMKDARFTIPTPNLLVKAVDALDELPLEHGDVKGDLYEYMLSKIATAGQNGQFRTPRHIIQLMVEMMNPGLSDEICDPACGTAGFLVAAAEYVQGEHSEALLERAQQRHFHHSMFHGFDFDSTMLRIASMNMLLHEVEQPDIRYRDSLAQNVADEIERYSLILANPPFAGSLDYETTAKDLLDVCISHRRLARCQARGAPSQYAAPRCQDGCSLTSSISRMTPACLSPG